MQIWLDSINVATIKHAANLGILSGVTTNPKILSCSTQNFECVIDNIIDIQSGWLAVQVILADYDSMVKQARKLAAISNRIIVKIPAVHDGFRVIATLEQENIATLATTIFESRQIVTAALCGASYAAPYVNRIEVAGGRAFETLEESQKIIGKYGLKTKILAASIKSVEQFIRCATIGVAAATLPDDVYHALFASNENIADILDQFDKAWASNAHMQGSRFLALE